MTVLPSHLAEEQKDLELLGSSGLFDEAWYLTHYLDIAEAKIDPLLHYLKHGGFEGRDPGPNFSSSWYMETYDDVKKSGINPLVHYLKTGKEEGRLLNPVSKEADLALISSSGLFDEAWYLTRYPDIAEAKIDPLLHYWEHGGFEGRDPGPNFSNNWYVHAYKDVKESGINPLVHYLKYGLQKGYKANYEPVDPILVHTMGKVGSKTIELSLQNAYTNLGINPRIYHTHVLNRYEAIRQKAMQDAVWKNPDGIVAAMDQDESIRKKIDENLAQHWNIVSLVRDPIARNVAMFFQNLPELIPDWRKRYADGTLDLHEMQALFLRGLYDRLDNWFDDEIKTVPAFGINVYATPFPREIGYKIYPGTSQASLLVIRLENLNECAGQAMYEFLNLKNFTLLHTNVGAEKDYADLYRAFKELPLPAEYVERIYMRQYAQHFYTHQDLDGFVKQWTKNTGSQKNISVGANQIIGKRQARDDSLHQDITRQKSESEFASLDLLDDEVQEDIGIGLPAGYRHYRAYVGPPGDYDLIAAMTFNLVTTLGLRQHHSVLDIGCGSLRIGRLLIPYLNTGKYTGIEPNQWLVDEGIRREIGRDQVRIKQPEFYFGDSADSLPAGKIYDFAIAQSVFSHSGSDLVISWLDGIHSHLPATGVLAATFVVGNQDDPDQGWLCPGIVRYKVETMAKLANHAGFGFHLLDWKHPRQAWALFTKPNFDTSWFQTNALTWNNFLAFEMKKMAGE